VGDEELPSGVVLYFEPDAVADATLLSNDMFNVIAISKADRQGNPEGVSSSVDQFSNVPALLSVGNKAPWEAELGSPSAFVASYYQLREDHKTKDYFFVANGTVPLVVQELKREVARNAPTYKELARMPSVGKAQHLARQNVQRNLARVAESCAVCIQRRSDPSAAAHPTFAPPDRADPHWEQMTHSIRETKFEGKHAVAIYNGVVPVSSGIDRAFITLGSDILVFPLATSSSTESTIPASIHSASAAKSALKRVGWNPEDHFGRMVAANVKSFDKAIQRGK
jgi:hypothetical protein